MKNNKKLLIVEDDPGLQSQLRWCFEGVEVFVADDEASAIEVMKEQQPQVVTLDLGLPPDAGGYSVGFIILGHIISNWPHTKVIVVTGQEDREHALTAINQGAYDFFNKPVDPKTLALVVERAFHLSLIEAEHRALAAKVLSSPLDGVISSCASMSKLCKTVEKIAPSDLSVMILGESGTGKEVFARAVHNLSHHSEGKFVAINCTAIPDSLLESELFGHEKGAFTGAVARKLGKIEVAQGGTLFLDEIGDMPLELQVKLLRFLQERVIERVGGTETIEINTRVICATHQDIHGMIENKTFREDLYYRVSDIILELPPLREREEDILLLAKFFIEKSQEKLDRGIKGLSSAAEQLLLSYECKGNVRELDKIIKRAVIMSDGPFLSPDDLNLDVELDIADEVVADTFSLKKIRLLADKRAVLRALTESSGNVSSAAKLLEITRPTLYSMIDKLDIDVSGLCE